jgi:hypothetical protein
LEDAAPQFCGRGSNPVDGKDHIVHQFIGTERTAVGEFSFSQRPHALIGIELRSVSRKVLDVQARVPTQELAQRLPVMGGGIVQQDNDATPKVPQQFPEKQAHFFLADVIEVKQIVEAQVLSLGADRNSGDDGDFVPASLAMTLQRSAASGCPSPDHQGSQQKARFIGED